MIHGHQSLRVSSIESGWSSRYSVNSHCERVRILVFSAIWRVFLEYSYCGSCFAKQPNHAIGKPEQPMLRLILDVEMSSVGTGHARDEGIAACVVEEDRGGMNLMMRKQPAEYEALSMAICHCCGRRGHGELMWRFGSCGWDSRMVMHKRERGREMGED